MPDTVFAARYFCFCINTLEPHSGTQLNYVKKSWSFCISILKSGRIPTVRSWVCFFPTSEAGSPEGSNSPWSTNFQTGRWNQTLFLAPCVMRAAPGLCECRQHSLQYSHRVLSLASSSSVHTQAPKELWLLLGPLRILLSCFAAGTVDTSVPPASSYFSWTKEIRRADPEMDPHKCASLTLSKLQKQFSIWTAF